jgi:nitric oxide reductase NorQ protein
MSEHKIAELEVTEAEESKRTRRTRAWMLVKSMGDNPIAFIKVLSSFNGKEIKENKMLIENNQCVIEDRKTGDVKSILRTLEAISENSEIEILYEAPVSAISTSPIDTTGRVTLGGYFKVDKATYNILLSNIKARRSTMLLGPTGVGKTELIKNIADSLGLPLTIFDMGTMSDPIMSLVGTHTISVKDDKTISEFIPSRFSEVIQKPGVILLDELSRAVVTANNLLFPCLDFRRELPMEYCFHNCEPVKVHPECVFIATANVGSQYTGTHKLDRALMDRFVLIEIDPLNEQMTKEVVRNYGKRLTEDQVKTIVSIYNRINKSHEEFRVNFSMSIRHLKNIVDLVGDGFTIYDSFFAICKGLGSKEGLAAVQDILEGSSK